MKTNPFNIFVIKDAGRLALSPHLFLDIVQSEMITAAWIARRGPGIMVEQLSALGGHRETINHLLSGWNRPGPGREETQLVLCEFSHPQEPQLIFHSTQIKIK